MSQSPRRAEGSRRYADAWRAINILIRSDGSWSGRERNLCFLNRGDGTFSDRSYLSGLDLDTDGRAFVPLDLDADGDLDLILKNRNGGQLRAFRNDLLEGGARSLQVRTVGRTSNRDGVGSRVWLRTDRRVMMREVASGSGYLSQRSRTVRFGLQPGEVVQDLRVRWPRGGVQSLADLPQDGSIVLEEGTSGIRRSVPGRPEKRRPETAGATGSLHGAGTVLARPVPAPGFDLADVRRQGSTVDLSFLRGRPVLLNFWATWCPPCRRELAHIQERLADFRGLGVEILAVSVDDPDDPARVERMANDLSLDFPVLLADAPTAEAYTILNERLFDRRRSLAIPTTFLLDADGRIGRVYRGEADVQDLLRAVSAEEGSALPFKGLWAESGPRRDFEELASAFAERGLGTPAMTMFSEALAEGQSSPRLLNNMAGALIAGNEPDRAERLLRQAIDADPGMTDAKVNLASLLAGRGKVSEAEGLLEQVLDSQPGDGQALSLLGSVRFSQSRLAEAETLFRKAAAEMPDDPRPRENLGAALASGGRFAEALAEYEAARELGAGGATFHTNLAVLYMQAGRARPALDAFLKASESAPADPGPHLNLARYWLSAGDPAQAEAAVDRAAQLGSGTPAVVMMRAQVLVAMGRDQEARTILRDLLRRYPGLEAAREMLDGLQ